MAAQIPNVGWQSGPDRRGTLSIVENCLVTIFACTWSIQHLNVPKLNEPAFGTLLRQCKWAVITVLFPEFIMAHAFLELVMAVENLKELDENGLLADNPPWFFRFVRSPHANSHDVETGCEKLPLDLEEPKQQGVKWSLTHCYFANMGGFYISDSTSPGSESGPVKNRLLTTGHFINCWRDIDMPRLSDDDLNDKSKSDFVAKGLAVFQIAQLLLSLISRSTQHLAFSQLETTTLAFAVCGVLTYGCSWYKPQNVKRPIQVSPSNGSDEELLKSKLQQPTFESLWHVVTNSKPNGKEAPDRISNDNIPKTKAHYDNYYPLYVMAVLAAGFGSIHAIAWNFEFPSPTEQLLWRIATLISTVAPPIALVGVPLSQIVVSWGDINNFRDTCLAVMREYSWHVTDNQRVLEAIATLQSFYDSPETAEHKHFGVILGDPNTLGKTLGEELLDFIQCNKELQGCLPAPFLPKFVELLDILKDSSSSKRLWDAARTDKYPKRRVFGRRINDGLVYITSIIYCLARLSLIGIAFSSLRQMPDSVYMVPLTNNIPSVQ